MARAREHQNIPDLRLTEYPVKPIKQTECQLTGLSVRQLS